MPVILRNEILAGAMRKVRTQAEKGIWNGSEASQYFKDCIWAIQEFNCYIIFTRDEGHHSSGWWKNPEYERCYHLSISFGEQKKNNNATRKILESLFGAANVRMLWCESPYSKEGKRKDVWHYRLFCTPLWTPMIPKGEVYSKEFTEIGWKSYSELHYEKKKKNGTAQK